LNDENVLGDHIVHYNILCTEMPDNKIENPIFIYENLSLMKMRLEYYQLSMTNMIDENDDSVTDNMKIILNENNYVKYLNATIEYYESKKIN
jgi:hypothetical protein